MNEPKAPAAILMYHSVASTTTGRFAHLTVDPRLLGEQIAALREAGAAFVDVAGVPRVLAERKPARAPVVAISIDDGLADAETGAAPVLAAHGVPATFFIPTGFVGGTAAWLGGEDRRRPMLSWSGIEALAADGMEIGSHGHAHLAADINHFELVREDATRSRLELEAHLGCAVNSYAYPFGYWSARARTAVRDAGFSQACAVMDLPVLAGDDRWSLPRLHVGPHTSPEALVQMACSAPARARREWVAVKQRVWRGGRRWAHWGPPEAGLARVDVVAHENAEGLSR